MTDERKGESMKEKYKYKFKEIVLFNRWLMRYPPDDWTLIGISKWWCGFNQYRYSVCFFGLEVRFWFERKFII